MKAPLTLTQALVRYDRLQSSKRHHNPYALGIYLQRAEEIEADIARGATPRDAIIAGFSDRLRDYVLRQMGLAPTGGRETRMTYQPVTDPD